MNPEPRLRVKTEIADFAEVLSSSDGSEPPVIVGGHAISLWAACFLTKGCDEMAKKLHLIHQRCSTHAASELERSRIALGDADGRAKV
jgi:hypothetical protein